ncbi:MAG TPA: C40 family peptidase [Mycobacteriales bacterium]|nr:C40 family peptidase [Mycobacteriales bacterium]
MLLLSRARLRASALLLLLVAAFGVVATATPASAALTTYQNRVMTEAARHKGQPYVYGAAGPTKFDCSGFTLYVFGRFGKRLPHNSARQYGVVRHIAKSSKQVGDLIFIRSSSGTIYHVGIYAGSGRMWHAPRSGSTVRLATIWTTSYVVGRA